MLDHPWTKCATDLFRLQGHYYLLVIDYYSKFIATENLQNSQTEIVINKCRNFFSQFGIPKKLLTDNGPEFFIHKFRSFSKTWDILHNPSLEKPTLNDQLEPDRLNPFRNGVT